MRKPCKLDKQCMRDWKLSLLHVLVSFRSHNCPISLHHVSREASVNIPLISLRHNFNIRFSACSRPKVRNQNQKIWAHYSTRMFSTRNFTPMTAARRKKIWRSLHSVFRWPLLTLTAANVFSLGGEPTDLIYRQRVQLRRMQAYVYISRF